MGSSQARGPSRFPSAMCWWMVTYPKHSGAAPRVTIYSISFALWLPLGPSWTSCSAALYSDTTTSMYSYADSPHRLGSPKYQSSRTRAPQEPFEVFGRPGMAMGARPPKVRGVGGIFEMQGLVGVVGGSFPS